MIYQRYLELVAVIVEELGEAVQAGNNFFWKEEGDLARVWEEFEDIRSPLDELIRRLEDAKEEQPEEFIMRETEAAIEGGIIDEETGLPVE